MALSVGIGAEGPVQRGWGLWLASVISLVLSALFVGARFVQRYSKRSGYGMDDYMIMASLISSALLSLTECQAVVYGYGRHWNTLDPDIRITARKWFYGANIMYKIVLLFNKMSVVCLYYRIFAVAERSFRIACHIMNGWIITSGLAFVIATIFQCSPIAAFWDRSIPGSKCFKNEPWWISYATIQITTDIVLLLLPIRRVLALSMGRAEKLGICVVFGTGAFVTFASIYRATTIAASANDTDPTWGPIPATIWSVIEANAGIICACLPMLRGPFVRLFGPIFGGSRKKISRLGEDYHLTWRSDKPNASVTVTSQQRRIDELLTGDDRYSEDTICINDPNTSTFKGKALERERTPSGIFVRNEFSVTDNLPATKDDSAGSTVDSVHEGRFQGKVTFSHV